MVLRVISLVLGPSPGCIWSTLVYKHPKKKITRKISAKYIWEEAFGRLERGDSAAVALTDAVLLRLISSIVNVVLRETFASFSAFLETFKRIGLG